MTSGRRIPHLKGELYGLPLTQREVEVLAAYAKHGYSGEVGATVGCAKHTVRNHLSNAYRKLGVDNCISAFQALGWLVVPGSEQVRAAYLIGQLEETRRVASELLSELRAA